MSSPSVSSPVFPPLVTYPASYRGWPLALVEVVPGQFRGFVAQGYASPVCATAQAALRDITRWCDQHAPQRASDR